MTAPTIRRAGPDDVAAIRALTRAAYAKWVPALGREPQPMGADHDRAVREDRVELAVLDGDIAALVHVMLRPGDLLVENLAVAPDRQGRGLGGVLLDHAERLAAQAGKPRVRLYTNRLMGWNVAFYVSRGYAIEGEEPFGNGTRVYLAKSLDAPA